MKQAAAFYFTTQALFFLVMGLITGPTWAAEGLQEKNIKSFLSKVAEAPLVNRIKEGDQIPPFVLSVPGSEEKISNESIKGKPAILVFFALDNKMRIQRSIQLLKELNKLLEKFGDKVRIFGICSDINECDNPHLKAAALNFPILDDSNRAGYKVFGLFMMPTTMIISPQGELLAKLPFNKEGKVELDGRIQIALGELSEEELQKQLTIAPTEEKTPEEKEFIHRLELARTLMQRRMYPQSLEEFKNCAKIFPDNKSLLLEMGFVQLKMKDWPGANITFNRILELDPEDLKAVSGLGLALHGSGKDEEAILELEDAAATVKPLPQVLIALAEIYVARGEKDKALETYAKAFNSLTRVLEHCETLEDEH